METGTNTNAINGGYYLKPRCIEQSDIAAAPPHVREIFDWMVCKANFADRDKLKRGQLVCTYKDIQESLCWFIGYCKKTYSKSQCETAMKWLTKHDMIHTARTTRGLIITVCNYSRYQNPENYENHSSTHTKATRSTNTGSPIHNNYNKEKNNNQSPTLRGEKEPFFIKEENKGQISQPTSFDSLTGLGGLSAKQSDNQETNTLIQQPMSAPNNDHNTKHTVSVSDVNTAANGPGFEEFWNSYNKNVGKVSAERLWKELLPQDRINALAYVPVYKAHRHDVNYRKNPDNYLRDKIWNDTLPAKSYKREAVKAPTDPDYYKKDFKL